MDSHEKYEAEMIDIMKEVSDSTYIEKHENGLILPVYWTVDNNNNINFDTESMREEFERMIESLERYNEESDFDWDNC